MSQNNFKNTNYAKAGDDLIVSFKTNEALKDTSVVLNNPDNQSLSPTFMGITRMEVIWIGRQYSG